MATPRVNADGSRSKPGPKPVNGHAKIRIGGSVSADVAAVVKSQPNQSEFLDKAVRATKEFKKRKDGNK